MALTDAERTDARRFCGYPVVGVAGQAGTMGWQFYQVYGLLEYRLANLADAEEAVVRMQLATLNALERGVPQSADNLDTDQASVWMRNRSEPESVFEKGVPARRKT